MQKWIMFVVFIFASLLSVYLIIFSLPEKPKDETEGLPEGVTLMKVVASNDFVFDKPEYRVKAGETVRLVLQNKSGIHGIEIAEFGINLQGDKLQQDVTFDKPGTYEIKCSVACGVGHDTMKSVLVVE